MRRVMFAVLLAAVLAVGAAAQAGAPKFRVYTGDGKAASLDDIVTRAADSDVVFMGEQHDDSVGHSIETVVFHRIADKYAATRKVALSLEMFERDVQTPLNEYLAGLITEQHFLLSSRPWGNYKTDYRPSVEYAKELKLDVIAANAPRRYVNMVSRSGRTSLDALSPEAKSWLPPLPFPQPSAAYTAKFKALMGPTNEAKMGIDNILASQTLWDASMADSIAKYLNGHKDALVVAFNGGFHTESRLGTVEQLLRYRPQTRVVVVTMKYVDDTSAFTDAERGTGDFVILTDSKEPRSQR